MIDLFNYEKKYPHHPGSKRAGTSQEAAERTKDRAPNLRNQVLTVLRTIGPMTPDECATEMQRSVLSVRPRLTELLKLGLIMKTEERRMNDSGMYANVYRARD